MGGFFGRLKALEIEHLGNLPKCVKRGAEQGVSTDGDTDINSVIDEEDMEILNTCGDCLDSVLSE